MATAVICIILVVICIFSVKGYLKKLHNGCCGAGGDSVKKNGAEDKDISHYPYQYTLSIEGMTCKNCASRIENAFHAQEGYYAKVNLKKKEAVVHAKKAADEFDLKQIVTRAGYEVTNVKAAE